MAGRIAIAKPRISATDTRRVKPPPKVKASIYYTPEFLKWREGVVGRARGLCQDPKCSAPGRRGSRLYADHVVELRDGGEPFDLANGIARCPSCHTRKTLAERAKRMTA